MHSTSSKPIILHGKGSKPFLVSKLFWLISALKQQYATFSAWIFLRNVSEEQKMGTVFFFLPALQWRILHKCIILITFSKLFAVLLITEELIKENYQTALPHSNHLVSLFCSAGCHNLPYSFIQRKAPRKEQLYNNFVFKHWKRKKRARAPFLISLSALRKEGGDHQ